MLRIIRSYWPYFLILLFTFVFYNQFFFTKGSIIFSDIAAGAQTDRYLQEIIGLLNSRFNSTTLFNMPRLIFILPSYLISLLFGAEWLTKSFVVWLSFLSATSMFHFSKHFYSFYLKRKVPKKYLLFVSLLGALFYGFNPWFLVRIQHTYLLCGYALLPLVIHFQLKIFNAKYDTNGNTTSSYLRFATLFSFSSAAIHYFFFNIIILFVLLMTQFLEKHSAKFNLRNFILKLAKISLFTFIACSYWLFPYLFSIVTGKMVSQSNINVEETLSMLSQNSSFTRILSFNSYWWDMKVLSPLTDFALISWSVLFLVANFGVYKYWKRNLLIKVFSIFSLIIFILSTGSYYSFLAPIHHFMVFKIPVFGNIFRDSDKLIGISSFFVALFIPLGFVRVAVFFKFWRKPFLPFVSIIILILFSFYDGYSNFILNYYFPTPFPYSFVESYDMMKKNDAKVMVMPIAETRVDPYKKFTHLKWNRNLLNPEYGKSVGDVYTYGLPKNTTFQYEGNSPFIKYTYRFHQKLMDDGQTRYLPNLLNLHFIDQLAFIKDFSFYDEVEKDNEKLFANQKNIKRVFHSPEVDLFDLTKNDSRSAEVWNNYIVTPNGLNQSVLYQHLEDANGIQNMPLLFSNQEEFKFESEQAKNMLFDYDSFEKLWLGLVPTKYVYRPFNFINSSRPELNWSKTSVDSAEWDWFMKSLGIAVYRHDVNFQPTAVATFSNQSLAINSYNLKDLTGREVFNVRDRITSDYEFIENTDRYLRIGISPSNVNDSPVLTGSVSADVDYKLWSIARSKKIAIKPSTPYKAFTSLSGLNANAVHIKINFFNEKDEDIGVTYISRPDNASDFYKTKFTTLFVTPEKSERMLISFYSNTFEDRKIFWWLHDFVLDDLSEHKKPNTISMKLNAKEAEVNQLYVKVFKSKKGGEVLFKINSQEINVNTKIATSASFEWVFLGEFISNENKTHLDMTNLSGFNAISDIIFIPTNARNDLIVQTENRVNQNTRLISLEGEFALNNGLKLQSERNYPDLSSGKAYTFGSDAITAEFDILKDQKLELQLTGSYINERKLEISINDSNKDRLIFNKMTQEFDVTNIYYEKLDSSPFFRYRESSFVLPIKKFYYKPVALKKGKNKIKFKLNSKPKVLADTRSVRKLNFTIKPRDGVKIDEADSTCNCSLVDPLRINYSNEVKTWTIQTENSCQWHILQSDLINIDDSHEYLIEYDSMDINTYKSHQKVLFLDHDLKEIDVKHMDYSLDNVNKKWISHARLITPPVGTKRMVMIFMFKGVFKEGSQFKLKKFRILDHTTLPKIDFVFLKENTDHFSSKSIIDSSPNSTNATKKYQIGEISNGSILKTNQPLNRLWKTADERGMLERVPLFGYMTGIRLANSQAVVTSNVPIEPVYWILLFIHCVFIIVTFVDLRWPVRFLKK